MSADLIQSLYELANDGITYSEVCRHLFILKCYIDCKLFEHLTSYLNFICFQLNQAIGSVEAIAKSSKESILENTDLSAEKAETISQFFRNPKLYLGAKIR